MKSVRTSALGFVVTGCFLALAPGAATAASINVTTYDDEFENVPANTVCSLREAVRSANSNVSYGGCTKGDPGFDSITLPEGTYQLVTPTLVPGENANGDLDVSDTLQITGTGQVTIDATGLDRAISHAASATLTIQNLTIINGAATSAGGGIANNSGTLVLKSVTLANNQTTNNGGGLANFGNAVLENVTISGNKAALSGGGIYSPGTATTSIKNTTIASNTADSDASTSGDGGGVSVAGTFNAFNSVIADNSDGSPTPAGSVQPDCASTTLFFAPRFTLIESVQPTCNRAADPGNNIIGQDPGLAALADNGGPVPTQALSPGSVAIDKGGSTGTDVCLPTDARGITRPQGAGCDLGAFERSPSDTVPGGGGGGGGTTTPGKCAGKTATITGTSAGDVLNGTAKRDIIAALGGNDKITGLGGNDLICGGGGNDTVIAGAGNDILLGQNGNDKLTGGTGKDILKGAKGKDRLLGGYGKDSLFGGPGKDTLLGGPGKDVTKQ